MCIAVGNVSFEDCEQFTSSFGWTGSFEPEHAAGELDRAVRDHLVHVHVRLGAAPRLPDPQRELAVERPVGHLVGRALDERRARVASRSPSARLTCADASFRMPNAWMTAEGIVSWPIAKWWRLRSVCAPQ